MTLVVDANVLFVQADADSPAHESMSALLHDETGRLVTTEAVLAEADYLILRRLGVDAELAFLDDVAAGTFEVECLNDAERRTAAGLARRHRDLELGYADASLIALAARLGTRRIATFDERAFRVVTPLQGGAFTLLPADTDERHG